MTAQSSCFAFPLSCHIPPAPEGLLIASSSCEHCRIPNEAISKDAGFESDVVYDQSEGRRVQEFWRREE